MIFKRIRKEKEKSRAVYISSNRHMERPQQKRFRCGSEDHMIAKCPEKLQSHYANMTFYDKSRYVKTFQQVTHKGG